MGLFRRRFRSDQRGATAIEYGLVAGIIAVALIGISATGGAVDALFGKLSTIVEGLNSNGGDGADSGGSGSSGG